MLKEQVSQIYSIRAGASVFQHTYRVFVLGEGTVEGNTFIVA